MLRTGAVDEAACRISANPRRSVQRLCPISEARVAPDRDQLWFPGLEHRRLDDSNRAGEVPARILGRSFPPGLEMPPDPNSDIPVDQVPGPKERRHQTVGTR
jgi:hypothetical protein